MNRTSPLFRRLTLGLLTLGLSGAAALFLVTRDEPPPAIDDLQPRPRTLADSDNALVALCALTAGRESPSDGDPAYDAALSRLLENQTCWDTAAATLVVNKNHDLWPRFDAALRLPAAETRQPWHPADLGPVVRLRSLWKIAMIRARLTAFSGQPETGFGQTLAALSAATRVSDAGGVLIEYLTGVSLRSITLSTLQTMAVQTPPSDACLHQAIAALDADRPSASALAETFKAEYANLRQPSPSLAQDLRLWQNPPAPPKASWFYKPNQTLRLYADEIRRTMPLIDHPLRDLSAPRTPSPRLTSFANLPNPDNAYGRYLFANLAPAFRKTLIVHLRDQTSISLTQVWLALILYQREHRALPETLAALVPAYLRAVPRDYFDGAPIRYSQAFRAVWSVGQDNFTVKSASPAPKPGDNCLKIPPPGYAGTPPAPLENIER